MILQVPAVQDGPHETRMPQVVLEVSKRYTAKKPAVAVGVTMIHRHSQRFGEGNKLMGLHPPPRKKTGPEKL